MEKWRAKLIPFGDSAKRPGDLDQDRPIIAVCRAGFKEIANLVAGMLRWRAQRCSVQSGRD